MHESKSTDETTRAGDGDARMTSDPDVTDNVNQTSPMSIDGSAASHGNGNGSNGNASSSPFYELRKTPNAGIGMFATTLIPSGTRIICEEETVVLPDGADYPDLYKLVDALPEHRQAPFWALAAYNRKHEVDWIPAVRAEYKGPSEGFEELCDRHEKAWQIYETNRFTVRSPSGQPDFMGIFVEAARLNHSCRPNVFHRHNYSIDRLTIHTLRDISPGEELFTSYIDICHATAERRRLLGHWAFKCRCTLCTAPDTTKTPSDLRRRRLEQLLGRMKRAEAKRVMDDWQQWDYAKALGVVEEVIGLMLEEEMEESDTLGEAYANAAEYAMSLGWWKRAQEWAGKCRDIEAKCLGVDSAEWGKADELVRAANEGG